MLKRFAFAVLLGVVVTVSYAAEVANTASCEKEGDIWFCTAFENNQLQVFRSERYLSKVELQGKERVYEVSIEPGVFAPKKGASKSTHLSPGSEGVLPSGKYTLQLVACNTQFCRQRMDYFKAIPGSQRVEIINQGSLWDLVIFGSYTSVKASQKAAATLIKRYRLTDKPKIRSVGFIRTRLADS